MNAFCKCLLSSAAAFAFALAPASAQRVPEEFTLSGDAAQRLGDYVSINAATAERLSDTCFETIQREANAASATIVILNAQGLTVHQVVKDGQRYTSVKITENKARTALMMRVPTIENMHDVAEDPLQLARYDQIGGLAPQAGGVPIEVNGQIIGAMGIGGFGGEERYHTIAMQCLAQVFGEAAIADQ
jgi:uncharacterized protein GlcG (DUF336 family)